jgi:hypothetical protein
MAIPLRVRGIDTSRHLMSEYVLMPMCFVGVRHKDKQRVIATFTREVHLVTDLQAKIRYTQPLEDRYIDLLVESIHRELRRGCPDTMPSTYDSDPHACTC